MRQQKEVSEAEDVAPEVDDPYPPENVAQICAGLPRWVTLGLGAHEYICEEVGATWPSVCPPLLPDLLNHHSLMAQVLRQQPEIYQRLRNKSTSKGVHFANLIKVGMDNPGDPESKMPGISIGDEESLKLFEELITPIVQIYHGRVITPEFRFISDFDMAKLSVTRMDPSGKYVLSTHCRVCRCISGFRLPPSNSFTSRREIEHIIVKNLKQMNSQHIIGGEYYPLRGSRSYPENVGRMTTEVEQRLKEKGVLFTVPCDTQLLSAGIGRHWPDARGVYTNETFDIFVWINYKDHLRVVSVADGDDAQNAFQRLVMLMSDIRTVLYSDGYNFMRSDTLGYVTMSPSNLGSTLRMSSFIRLPMLRKHSSFLKFCSKLGLGVKNTDDPDVVHVYNLERISRTEVMFVNLFVEGVHQLVQLEQKAEAGHQVLSLERRRGATTAAMSRMTRSPRSVSSHSSTSMFRLVDEQGHIKPPEHQKHKRGQKNAIHEEDSKIDKSNSYEELPWYMFLCCPSSQRASLEAEEIEITP